MDRDPTVLRARQEIRYTSGACAGILGAMDALLELRKKLSQMWPHLNERSRRMVAAAEALALGYGGVSLVNRACGLSRVTITGIGELKRAPLPEDRIRRPEEGAIDWRCTIRNCPRSWSPWWSLWRVGTQNPPCGGPARAPARWPATDPPAHRISHETVAHTCGAWATACKATAKPRRGRITRTATAQFRHINREVQKALKQGWPVISSTPRRRNSFGNYENQGDNGVGPRRRSKSMVTISRGPRCPGVSLRHLRPEAQPGLCQCRHRSRHRRVCVASIRGWCVTRDGGCIRPPRNC